MNFFTFWNLLSLVYRTMAHKAHCSFTFFGTSLHFTDCIFNFLNTSLRFPWNSIDVSTNFSQYFSLFWNIKTSVQFFKLTCKFLEFLCKIITCFSADFFGYFCSKPGSKEKLNQTRLESETDSSLAFRQHDCSILFDSWAEPIRREILRTKIIKVKQYGFNF